MRSSGIFLTPEGQIVYYFERSVENSQKDKTDLVPKKMNP
jgi:hypothetical protein